MVFGRCHILLPDKGPGYTGKYMEAFCESWSILHVTVPTSASNSNGLIERNVSLLKEVIKSARVKDTNSTDETLLEEVVMARNLVPTLATGIFPMTAMCGRADVFAGLGKRLNWTRFRRPEVKSTKLS